MHYPFHLFFSTFEIFSNKDKEGSHNKTNYQKDERSFAHLFTLSGQVRSATLRPGALSFLVSWVFPQEWSVLCSIPPCFQTVFSP